MASILAALSWQGSKNVNGTWRNQANREDIDFLGRRELTEWLSSDVFSKTLDVSLNRAKDSTWRYWLGGSHGCLLGTT
jgi:hypothetical protein